MRFFGSKDQKTIHVSTCAPPFLPVTPHMKTITQCYSHRPITTSLRSLTTITTTNNTRVSAPSPLLPLPMAPAFLRSLSTNTSTNNTASTPPPPPMSPELNDFRHSLRKWVKERIIPNINDWDEQGRVPSSIYKEAGNLGIFGVGFAEEYGGLGNHVRDLSVLLMVQEELCKAGNKYRFRYDRVQSTEFFVHAVLGGRNTVSS